MLAPVFAQGQPVRSRCSIANRGEIALRIIRACHELGMEAVAVYSDADARARTSGRRTGRCTSDRPRRPRATFAAMRSSRPALATGAQAVHPGYGFLAERASFAEAVAAAGMAFVGPDHRAIAALGDKLAARRTATAAGRAGRPRDARAGAGRPSGPGRLDRRGRRRRRLSAARQGGGRWWRAGDAPRRGPARPAGGPPVGVARGGLGVRRRVGLSRARDPAGAPHRGPAAG